MSSSDLALSIQGVSKCYKIAPRQADPHARLPGLGQRLRNALKQPARKEEFWALKDVSFDVYQGDVVGIIGRNGAGKSTLLKILSRITEPTTGTVELFGRVGSLLEVGTGFHPELTGRENVYLNGSIHGMSRAEISRLIDEIVEFSGVERFLETPVKRYSSGMYVRLAFAVAAHLEPEILIVDEVLAVGDAEFQKKCIGKMEDVAALGRTVLFVSHNEAAVKRLCHRAVLLKSGAVEMIGSPDEAFRRYRVRPVGTELNRHNRRQDTNLIEIEDAYLSTEGAVTCDFDQADRVRLTLTVCAKSEATFWLEALVRDGEGNPILFAPTGLTQDFKRNVTPGRYTLGYDLQLPSMASGEYSLDLNLAGGYFGFHDYLEQALRFTITAPSVMEMAWEYLQSRGQGCVLFEVGNVTLEPAEFAAADKASDLPREAAIQG